MKQRRWWRRFVVAGVAAFAMWWLVGFGSAWIATRPANVAIAQRSEIHGRRVEDVATVTSDGLTVRGWLVRAGTSNDRCVVLAAGIHGNRLAMLDRADFYLSHGWSALVVDLRGTGASDAAPISMGWFESRDLLAWRGFLVSRGFAGIAAHGCSLGAAAIVYAGDQPWEFVVLESCYGDLDSALAARLPFVPVPSLSFWPLRCCAEWRLGLDWSALQPVQAIEALRAPLLLLCGEADIEVGPDATAKLLAAAGAARKQAVMLPGLGHADLWARQPEQVEAALVDFVR